MAFEKGNKLASKCRAFDGALRRAIAQDDGQRLRKAAEALLDAAADGKPWALAQLADRLDGKAEATVNVNGRSIKDLTTDEIIAQLAAEGVAGEEAGVGADIPVH